MDKIIISCPECNQDNRLNREDKIDVLTCVGCRKSFYLDDHMTIKSDEPASMEPEKEQTSSTNPDIAPDPDPYPTPNPIPLPYELGAYIITIMIIIAIMTVRLNSDSHKETSTTPAHPELKRSQESTFWLSDMSEGDTP